MVEVPNYSTVNDKVDFLSDVGAPAPSGIFFDDSFV
jgi:hypothetical protein